MAARRINRNGRTYRKPNGPEAPSIKLLTTLASIVLAAAAPVGPPSLEAVQNEFKENLADPDNARFRNEAPAGEPVSCSMPCLAATAASNRARVMVLGKLPPSPPSTSAQEF